MECKPNPNDKTEQTLDAIHWNADCTGCGYCVRGLPFKGRCPECGMSYIAEPPSEALALEQFRHNLPAWMRFGITTRFAMRHWFITFVAVVLAISLSTIFLISMFCLATKIGFSLPSLSFPAGAT